MRRLVASAVFAGLAIAGAPGIAAAGSYPPIAPTVEVTPASIVCGADVTVSGTGWLGGSTVTITLTSDPVVLGSATVAADGSFQGTFATPTPLDVGQHSVTASGTASDGTAATASTTLTVSRCGGAGGGALALTGSDGLGLLEIAVVLILIGLVLAIALRRRRRAALAG
jgi:hypothetical protein